MSEILARFERTACGQPDRPAMYVPGLDQAITASELWQAHLEMRERLSAIGIGSERLVVSAAGNRPASISVLLACLALRAPIMPVDTGSTASEIAELAARFGASATVFAESHHLVGDVRIVRHDTTGATNYRGAALLKLTSGSTGPSKAALTSEQHLIADGERILNVMGIRGNDIQLAAIPLSHSYGIGNLVMPLLLGGTAMVLRESFMPQQVLLDARRFNARVFPGVPYMFNYFVANPPEAGWPPSLELLISAGARLDPQTTEAFHEKFAVKIHSFYGASETGGIAYDASDTLCPDGDVGKPMVGVSITIRPDNGAPLGSGRILIHSSSVASGYHANTEEQDDPFTDSGFLTGDYGVIDDGGHLILTGRASAAVNVAGRKVNPSEVERVLRRMAGIDDACVIAAPDERRGQKIVACIASRQILNALDVRRFCAASLASYKVPRAIIFLPVLPLTERGKIDRASLLALALQQLKDSV